MLSRFSNQSIFSRVRQFTPKGFATTTAAAPATLYRSDFRRLKAYEAKVADVQNNNRVRGNKMEYFITQMVNSSKNNHKERPFYNTMASANSFYYRRNYSYNLFDKVD
jgi:hypothetical protein